MDKTNNSSPVDVRNFLRPTSFNVIRAEDFKRERLFNGKPYFTARVGINGAPTDTAVLDAGRLAEACAAIEALVAAASIVESRIEQASKAIHDSTRWDEETMYSPNDDGPTIYEWIVGDLRAALAKFGGAA